MLRRDTNNASQFAKRNWQSEPDHIQFLCAQQRGEFIEQDLKAALWATDRQTDQLPEMQRRFSTKKNGDIFRDARVRIQQLPKTRRCETPYTAGSRCSDADLFYFRFDACCCPQKGP